eukprot:XP_011662852.1 PREDICTED: mucin-17 [Strongylocentrotus purpuratus]
MASIMTDGITTAQSLSEVSQLIPVTSDGNATSEINAITLSTVYETFSNVMTEMVSSELAIQHKSITLPDVTEGEATLTPDTLNDIETSSSTISVLDSSTSEPVTLGTPTYQERATAKTTIGIDTITELVTDIVDITLLSNTQDEILSHRGYQRDEVTETTASRYPDTIMTTEFEGTQEPELPSDLQTTLIPRTDPITSHRPTGQSSAGTTNVEKEINIRLTIETGEPTTEFSTDVVPQSSETGFPTNEVTSEKMVKSTTERTHSDIVTETELVTETADPASMSTSPGGGTIELTTIEGFFMDELGETTEPSRSVAITEIVTQDIVTDQTNDINITTDSKETIDTEMYADVVSTIIPEVTQTVRDSSAENGTIMQPAATEVTRHFELGISDATTIVKDITAPEIRTELRATERDVTPPKTYGTTSMESITTKYQSTMSGTETETEISTDIVTYVTDQTLGLARSDVAGPRGHATDLGSTIISRTKEESPTQTTTKYITTGVSALTEVATSTSIEFETAIVDDTTAPSGRETLAGEAGIVTEDETTESTEATRIGVDTTEGVHTDVHTDVMTSIVQEETSTVIPDSRVGRQTATIPTPITYEITSKEATAWISTNLGETTTSDFVTNFGTIEDISDTTPAVSFETLLTERIALESPRSDFITVTAETTATEEDEITTEQQLRTTVKKSPSEKATYPEIETHTKPAETFVTEIIDYTLRDDIISPDNTAETKFSTSAPLSIITATEITTALQNSTLRSTSTTADYTSFSTDETVEPSKSDKSRSPAEATTDEHKVGSTTADKLATDSKMAQETEWYTDIVTSMISEKPNDTASSYDIITKGGQINITRTTAKPSITDSYKDLTDVSVLATTEGTSLIGGDVTTRSSHEKTQTTTLHVSPVQNVSEVKETTDSLYTSMGTDEGTDIASHTLPATITTTSPITMETKVILGTEWYTEPLTSVVTDSDPISQVLPSSTIKSLPTEITNDLRSTEQYPASTSLKQDGITSPALGTEPLIIILTSEIIPMRETEKMTTDFPDATREATYTAFATETVTDISTQPIMSGKSEVLSTLDSILREVATDGTASLGTHSQTETETEETVTTPTLTEIVQEVTYIDNHTLGPSSPQEIITAPEDIPQRTTDKPFEMPDTTPGGTITFTELVTSVSNGTTGYIAGQMTGLTSPSRINPDNKVTENAEWYTDIINFTLTGSERTSDIIPTVKITESVTADIIEATNTQFTSLSTEDHSTVVPTRETASEGNEITTPVDTETVTDIIDIFTDMLSDTTDTLHGDTSRTKLGTDEQKIETTEEIPSTVGIEITKPVSDLGTEVVSTEYSSELKPDSSPAATLISTISKYVSEIMLEKTEQTEQITFLGTDIITDTYGTREPILPVEGNASFTTERTTSIGTDLKTDTYDETTEAMVTYKVTDTIKQTTFVGTDLITDTYESTKTILPVDGTTLDSADQTTFIRTDESTESLVPDEGTTAPATETESTDLKRTTDQMSTSNIAEHHTETTQIPQTEAETIVITEFMTDILNWTVESRTSNIPLQTDIVTEIIKPTTLFSYDLIDPTKKKSTTDISFTEEDERKPAISSTPLPFVDSSTTIAEFETAFVTIEFPDVTWAETPTSPSVHLTDTVSKGEELGIPSTALPTNDSSVTPPKMTEVTSQIKTTLMTGKPEFNTMDLTTRGRFAVSEGSKERLETISTDQPTEFSRLPVDSTVAIFETELLTVTDVVDESFTSEGTEERHRPSMVPKQETVFPRTDTTSTREKTTAMPVILQTVVSQPVSKEKIYHTSEITTDEMLGGLYDTTEAKSTSKPSTLGITEIHTTSDITETTRAAYTAPLHSVLLSTEIITTPYTPYDLTVDLNTGVTEGDTTDWATPMMLYSTEKIPMVHSTDEMQDVTEQILIPQTIPPSNESTSHVTSEESTPFTETPTTEIPVTPTTEGAGTEWVTLTIFDSTENVPMVPTTDEMQDLMEPTEMQKTSPSVNATVSEVTSEASTSLPKTQTAAVASSVVLTTDLHTTTLVDASKTEGAATEWVTFTIPDSTEEIQVVTTTDDMQDLMVQTDIQETTPQVNTSVSKVTSGVSTSSHKTQTTAITSSAIPTTDFHTMKGSTVTESIAPTKLLSTEDVAVFPTTDEMQHVTERTSFQQTSLPVNASTSQVTTEISTSSSNTPATTVKSSELEITDIHTTALPFSTMRESTPTGLTHTIPISTKDIAVFPTTDEMQDLIEQTEVEQTTISVSGRVSQFSSEVSTSSLKTQTTDIASSASPTTDFHTMTGSIATESTTPTKLLSTEDIAVFPTTNEMQDLIEQTEVEQTTISDSGRVSQVSSTVSTSSLKTKTTVIASSVSPITDFHTTALPVSTMIESTTTGLTTPTIPLSTEDIAIFPTTDEMQDVTQRTSFQHATSPDNASTSQGTGAISTSSIKTARTMMESSELQTTDIHLTTLPVSTTREGLTTEFTPHTKVLSTADMAVVQTTDEIQDVIGQTEIQQTTPLADAHTSQAMSEVSTTSPETPTTAMSASALTTTDILTAELSITTTETDKLMLRSTPTILLSTEDIAVVPTTDEIQELIEQIELQQTTSSVRATVSHVTSALPISIPQTRKTAMISSVVSTTESDTTILPTSTTGTDKDTLLSLSSQMSSTSASVLTVKVKATQPTQSISEPTSATMKTKCGVKCEGPNEVCIISVEGDSCRCLDGYERVDNVCIEIYTFKADVKIVLIKGKEALFIPDLNDPSSIKFNELVAEFCQAMKLAYKTHIETTSSFHQCDVIAFRPGSIVVEYLVKFMSPDINEAMLTNETLVYLEENNMTFPREISLKSSLVEYEPANECLLNLSDCDPAAKCINRGSALFTCECSSGYDDLYEKQLPGRYCSAIHPGPNSSLAIRIKVLIILGIVVIFIILIILLALCITRLYRRIIGRRSDDFIATSSEVGSTLLGYGYRKKNDVEGISYISQHSTLEKRGSLVEVHHEEEMTESPRSRTDTELIHTGVQPFECEEVLVTEEMDRELQLRMESISKFLKRSAPLNNSLRDRIDYSIMYIPEAPTIPLHERRRSAEQPTEEFLDSLPQTYL